MRHRHGEREPPRLTILDVSVACVARHGPHPTDPEVTSMIDQRSLLDVFREFATRLLGPYEIGPVLYELADQVVAVLGVDGAAVSLADSDGVLHFVTATDADVAAIEEEQVAHDQGPCQEAFRTGQPVVVADLAACRAWPD